MKRFYKNTLMSGAFSKALRVVALLCVLLGFSSSAWGETYYLWYTTTNNNNFSSTNDYKWSDAKTDNNGICTWTISGLNSGNNYFYISKTKDTSKLLNINILVDNKATSLVNGLGKQEYNVGNQYAKGVRVSCINSNTTITLTFDFSNSSQITVTATSGGAGGCTPSATITGASYDGTQINLSGSLTETCSSLIYYGWQYKTSANGDWEDAITGAASNSSKVAIDYSKSWNNGGNLVPGTTYYFRAYATYDAKTWYSDNKILSVTIPNDGGSTGEADCSGVVYLNPGVWDTNGNPRYEAYFWADGIDATFVTMKKAPNCTSLYYATIPSGCNKVIFVRMDPSKPEGLWESKWNQTGDNSISSDDKREFRIVQDGGTWDDVKENNWYTTDCTDGCIPAEQPSTNVLLSREAIVNKSAKTAQLFGYLKSTNCPESAITDYGFFYCMVNDGDAPCLPTSSSTKIVANPTPALSRGEEFTATVGLIKEPSDALQDGKTYYYRAYAKIDDEYILSGEIRSFATDPCIPQYGGLSDKYNGNPIVYTINADPSFVANDCKLRFNSLQAAIDHLKETYTKDNDFKYVTKSGDSYNLNQPVIMKVHYFQSESDGELGDGYYYGTTNVGNYAGSVKPNYSNLFEDINKTATDAKNTLTIKPGNKVAKPLIHHIVIRNSKNIVLDSLCIYSDPDGTLDNALEIDVNSTGWNNLTTGQFTSGNITIQNCLIHSSGFTGIHVSAYDGLTFKNNEFEAKFKGSNDANTKNNMLNWGASVKFLACKNIKFIQNNFIGSQPTSLWVQECQNVLFMNNVFWNTNEFVPDKGSNKAVPSAVRLVSQYDNNINNVGFYYNTFYFANNDVDASWAKFNFFNQCSIHRGGDVSKFGSDIYFKYNNCYSYDLDCPGKYDVTGRLENNDANAYYQTIDATSTSDNFCPNNFWSKYDEAQGSKTSAFAFGCSDNEFVNVSTQVCSTSAIKPSSLIVKGSLMNNGVDVNTVIPTSKTSTYIELTNIELAEDEQYSDRYEMGVRSESGWTYGAYQSRADVPTSVIYWIGNTSDWDDRNNWEYEKEEAGVLKRIPVSCVNSFSEDLKVVIEEVGTYQVADGRKWPQVPASFTENRTNSEYDEHVSAGLGTGKTPTKFASTIELEYGAGIKGVENLREADGTLRYDRAITHFDAPRDKWLLVGTVVKPFEDEKTGTTRNVISRDYYRDFLPQVYMRETVVNGDQISWTKTFPDLDTEVLSTTVFAINAVNKYGPSFQEAVDYNAANGTNYDGSAPIPYTFTGRFAVEQERDNAEELYAFTIKNDKELLNNNYPCNLDAKLLEAEYGTVNVYNYENGAFESTNAGKMTGNVYIKAQNGFVFTPKNGQLKIQPSFLVEGSTRTRSVERELPTFSLNVDNANTTKPGASNVVIRYDQEQEAFFDAPLNTPKVFTKNLYTPEVYIINNDAFYSRLYVGNGVTQVPLGLRLLRAMNVTFQKVYNEQFTTMILVDTQTGKEYNLLARNYTTEKLDKGTIEGRFYLKFAVEDQDDFQEDDDFTTDIEDALTEQASINIYAVGNSTVRVLGNNTELQQIYVSDMAGRTMRYDASGNFAELQLPVSQGVYLVQVIADNVTRTEKVVIK